MESSDLLTWWVQRSGVLIVTEEAKACSCASSTPLVLILIRSAAPLSVDVISVILLDKGGRRGSLVQTLVKQVTSSGYVEGIKADLKPEEDSKMSEV